MCRTRKLSPFERLQLLLEEPLIATPFEREVFGQFLSSTVKPVYGVFGPRGALKGVKNTSNATVTIRVTNHKFLKSF
jgi:hypothetical protein